MAGDVLHTIMPIKFLSLFENSTFSPTFIVDETTLGFDLITLNIFGQAKSSRYFCNWHLAEKDWVRHWNI